MKAHPMLFEVVTTRAPTSLTELSLSSLCTSTEPINSSFYKNNGYNTIHTPSLNYQHHAKYGNTKFNFSATAALIISGNMNSADISINNFDNLP
jgi:hypothetical protein